jgi:hypothetical protein
MKLTRNLNKDAYDEIGFPVAERQGYFVAAFGRMRRTA